MTQDSTYRRALLAAAPLDIFRRLPEMGRIMLITQHRGNTHERIGTVEDVTVEDGRILCRGASHDAVIEADAISSIVVDRTGQMKDKVLPRILFRDAQGDTIVSAIGMEGVEPFDAALAAIEVGEALPEETSEPVARTELGESDPAAFAFESAIRSGAPVTVEIQRPGLVQRWQGTVEAIKPSMGFINVMLPDFHLHIRGGTVARWREQASADGQDAVELWAENSAGEPTGLVVRGSSAALAVA